MIYTLVLEGGLVGLNSGGRGDRTVFPVGLCDFVSDLMIMELEW